jgi:membrane-bound serine protease (ClpP class)
MKLIRFLWLALILWAAAGARQAASGTIPLLTLEGPLSPAMAGYLERGIQQAEAQNAPALIVQLNTPGGSLNLMNRMVTDIRASRVPVVVHVTPRGAMAASAGAILTMAGHASAMAPETTIGAASPVGAGGADLGQTIQAKLKNELSAIARSLTEQRSPQAQALAVRMITRAVAVTAGEALAAGLVDFPAESVDELIARLDGFRVTTAAGPQTLRTAGAQPAPFRPNLAEQLLGLLGDPNVVALLLLAGVASLLIELASPGGWVAGFFGVVCLALAAYGFGVLPVNWFGAAFVALAFVLFVLDIKAPTHGALTLAGVFSLGVGVLVLFNTSAPPGFPQVSIPLVAAASLITGGLFFGMLLIGVRAQKLPVLTGVEAIIGLEGTALTDLTPGGQVQAGGERWSAELNGGGSLPKGGRIKVLDVKGLKLFVQPVESETDRRQSLLK